MRSLLCLAALSAGCGGPVADWYTDQPWEWRSLTVQVDPAFDPKLEGDPELQIRIVSEALLPESCQVGVTLTAADGQQAEIARIAAPSGPEGAEITWDGMLNGAVADPGPVQVAAELACAQRLAGFGEASTYVLRLGPGSLDFRGEGKVPLAWHKRDLVTKGLSVAPHDLAEWRQSGAPLQLDAPDGLPYVSPPSWDDPNVPPWGHGEPAKVDVLNLPVAYAAGSPFTVHFTAGERAVSARTGQAVDARGPLATRESLPIVRVIGEGLSPVDEPEWSPGQAVAFDSTADTALPFQMGLHEIDLTWRFQALVDGEWIDVPGHATSSHAVYVLAGQTAVLDGTEYGASPAASWVGVLEDLRPAVQGLAPDDPASILDALRDHLYGNAWFVYNPSDSSYSSFSGRYIYWSRIWTDMSDFLDRRSGMNLYCHSVACLLSSQANHLGIEAEYVTIVNQQHPESGRTFRTWLTRAAGSSRWRQWTFNSHGVVGLNDHIWDAAVDIDSDEAPGSEPVVATSPKGLPIQDYFDLLTANDMIVVNGGRCHNY